MDSHRLHLHTTAAIAAATLAMIPAVGAGATPVTAGTEGAAEHAALPYRAFLWSLIATVGTEGAAEHDHLP